MIPNSDPRIPVKQMSGQDIDQLAGLYVDVLPVFPDDRRAQMQKMLADIPPRERRLIIGAMQFTGGEVNVTTGVVVTLRDIGEPVIGRTAMGYFVRSLAAMTVDAESVSWLGSLFHKYILDNVNASEAMREAEWRGVGLPQVEYQAIINENTLQPMYFVERALAASKGVVQLWTPTGFGSGFLVGDGLVMTCNHVLPSSDNLSSTLVSFNYQIGANGQPLPETEVKADPQGPFLTSPKNDLDFTIFAIKSGDTPADAKPLRFADRPAEVGQRVTIIQHPDAGYKMISMRNNLVEYADPKILQYTTSTKEGSSGAPVLNDDGFEVVGVHNKAVRQLVEPVSGARFARNEGSTAQAILEFIEAKDPALHERLASSR